MDETVQTLPACAPMEKNERVTQEEVLNWVVRFYLCCGRGPTMQEIAAELGLKSTSSAAHHVRKLEALGLLEVQGSGRTGVYPTDDGKRVVLGLKPGCPLCNPTPAPQHPDRITPLHLFRQATRADLLPFVDVENLRVQTEASYPVVAICDLAWPDGLIFRDVRVCRYTQEQQWVEFPPSVAFTTTSQYDQWQAAALLRVERLLKQLNRAAF